MLGVWSRPPVTGLIPGGAGSPTQTRHVPHALGALLVTSRLVADAEAARSCWARRPGAGPRPPPTVRGGASSRKDPSEGGEPAAGLEELSVDAQLPGEEPPPRMSLRG